MSFVKPFQSEEIFFFKKTSFFPFFFKKIAGEGWQMLWRKQTVR